MPDQHTIEHGLREGKTDGKRGENPRSTEKANFTYGVVMRGEPAGTEDPPAAEVDEDAEAEQIAEKLCSHTEDKGEMLQALEHIQSVAAVQGVDKLLEKGESQVDTILFKFATRLAEKGLKAKDVAPAASESKFQRMKRLERVAREIQEVQPVVRGSAGLSAATAEAGKRPPQSTEEYIGRQVKRAKNQVGGLPFPVVETYLKDGSVATYHELAKIDDAANGTQTKKGSKAESAADSARDWLLAKRKVYVQGKDDVLSELDPPGTCTFAVLGFGEDQINLFRNVATNEELGVDTAPIRALVSQVAEIKLEIVRIVAAKMDLSHGSNAALAEIVDALLQGHLASKNMLALTVEVFANDPLVAPDVSFEDTTLMGQKKLLFGVGDGPANKFLKMANLVLNAAAPRLKDQFLEALGDIFRWRILCHHDSGKALYTNLQIVPVHAAVLPSPPEAAARRLYGR